MRTNFLAQLYKIGVVGLFVSTSFLASCKQDAPVGTGTTPTTTITSPIPKTPPQIIVPSDNKPLNLEAEIELGRHLFYDKQMSVDGSTSCASCHQADKGFSDLLQTSRGMKGQLPHAGTNLQHNMQTPWPVSKVEVSSPLVARTTICCFLRENDSNDNPNGATGMQLHMCSSSTVP